MASFARQGDPSDHGGKIISGSSVVFTDGQPAAREGDLHQCPIPGHGTTPMTSTATVYADGKRRVRVNTPSDHAGCGAIIIKGSPTAGD